MARNKQKASEADLQVFLSGLAESERGLRFRVIGSKEVGTMLSLTDFPRSGNPVYEFSFLDSAGDPATAVAYTNIVDSSKRVATRADALGKAIAAAGLSFFELNPFLLIFDYKEKRCMAVSGAALFAVFEKATTSEELPTPAYGFFSMSPHFGNQTISMYGEVPSSSLHCFAADSVPSSRSSGELRKLLLAMKSETEAFEERIPDVIDAVKARISGDKSSTGAEVLSLKERPQVDLDDGFVCPLGEDGLPIVDLAIECLSRGHLMLYGPPGTGKTTLAKGLARAFVGDRYLFATATADWSSFETVGGYMPDEDEPSRLTFAPGFFLQCFSNPDSTPSSGRWSVLDEVNRADIDKVFGPLFGVLAGQGSQLPFKIGGVPVRIVPESDESPGDSSDFIVPTNWRLIGTMNTHDKASLFQLSYAFMRRFAWIYVGLPPLREYVVSRGVSDEGRLNRVVGVWQALNEIRVIGPSLFFDVLAHCNVPVKGTDVTGRARLVEGLALYVAPQLEGVDLDKKVEVVDAIGAICCDGLGEGEKGPVEAKLASLRRLVLEVF